MAKFFLITLLFLVLGCEDPDRSEGPCPHIDIPGTAKIISIETADPSAYNCRNAVEVLFNFVPDDPTAPQRYRFPDWPDTRRHLMVGAGMNPALEWVTAEDISVGKEYHCLRIECLPDPCCAPVGFDILEIDFSDWADYCF